MKKRIRILKHQAITTVIILVISAAFLSPQTGNAQVAFKNVSVISFEPTRLLNGQTVVVVDGEIQKIGPVADVEIPGNIAMVDGTGKFLMPGLMDSHAHLPGPQGIDMKVADYLLLQLAHGVTSLRVSRYEDEFLGLRLRIAEEEWAAPRMFLSAPVISHKSQAIKNPLATFKRYKAIGYDHIKYLSGLTPIEHEAYVKAAHKAGLPIFGHLLPHIELSDAIRYRQSGIEHFHGFTNLQKEEETERIKKMVAATGMQRIFHCPTISWYHGYTLNFRDPDTEFHSRPGLEYLPQSVVQSWDQWLKQRKTEKIEGDKSIREKVLANFVGSDVPMLISAGDGYYFVPGLSMYEEMKIFGRAGYSNEDILRFATYNGADFYGQTHEFGNVKEGLRSDLVFLGANPISDLKNIHAIEGVMVGKRWYTKADLKSELTAMIQSRKSFDVNKMSK